MGKYGSGTTIAAMEAYALHGCEGEPGVADVLGRHRLRAKDVRLLNDLVDKYGMRGKDKARLFGLAQRLSMDEEEGAEVIGVIHEVFYQWRASAQSAKALEDTLRDACGDAAFMALCKWTLKRLAQTGYDADSARAEFMESLRDGSNGDAGQGADSEDAPKEGALCGKEEFVVEDELPETRP